MNKVNNDKMKRRHSYKISNRKRSKQTNPNDINENITPSKKFKSDKTKKSKNLTLKKIDNFMAYIDDEYNDIMFEEKKKVLIS